MKQDVTQKQHLPGHLRVTNAMIRDFAEEVEDPNQSQRGFHPMWPNAGSDERRSFVTEYHKPPRIVSYEH